MSDYIKREDAIKKIKEQINNPLIVGWLTRLIISVPAADDVKVKHGRWIADGYSNIENVCSQCGSEIPLKSEGGKIPKRQVKFCYYCGAKMDLED